MIFLRALLQEGLTLDTGPSGLLLLLILLYESLFPWILTAIFCVSQTTNFVVICRQFCTNSLFFYSNIPFMLHRNEIFALYELLRERFNKRPLVIPAVLLVVLINAYVYLCFEPAGFSCSDSVGYVRSCEYKLDGSVTYEINIDNCRVTYRDEDSVLLNVGDRVVVNGVVVVPDPPTNPGEFDYSRYLRSRGITGVLYADSIVVTGSPRFKFVDFINKTCFVIRQYVIGLFDESDQGLAGAVFMGDKSLVEDSVIRDFKLSNCSHLLAVSGTHFSGFLMIVSAFLSEMRFKKRNAVPVYLLFCIL